MKTFVIIFDANHTMGGPEDFRVHIKGCRDIAKHMKHPRYGLAGNSWERQAETACEAVAAEVAAFVEQDMDYQASHFKICDCCK